MSYTTIKGIWPGEKHEDLQELHNSWGSAPPVWDALCQQYLGWEPHRYLSKEMQPLWDLWQNLAVPKEYRAVLLFTFDRMYVAKKDYHRLAEDIRAYLKRFPIPEKSANHWPEIARFLDTGYLVAGI